METRTDIKKGNVEGKRKIDIRALKDLIKLVAENSAQLSEITKENQNTMREREREK